MRLLVLLTLFMSQLSLAEPQKKILPLQSSEEMKFLDKKDNSFYGFLKTDDFVGFIERKKEVNPDLQTLDYYQFQKEKKSAFDQKRCEELLAKIFGPLKEITLKVSVIKFEKLANGTTLCQAKAIDPDTHASIPERLVFIRNQKNFDFALVARLSKKSDESTLKNLQKFTQGLK